MVNQYEKESEAIIELIQIYNQNVYQSKYRLTLERKQASKTIKQER